MADLSTLSLTHFCSCLPSGSCGCGLLLHLMTNLSTLFLCVCINSSFSVLIHLLHSQWKNSSPWQGLMYISLLYLSLNLPGFTFLNGSPLLKLLMDLTAFLFNDMVDTLPLSSTVNWFDFFQGCLYCWPFTSLGWTFWLASTAFIFLSIFCLLLFADNFIFPSSVTFSWWNLSISASNSPWYLADCKSSTSAFWPQLLLIFLLNESDVAILDATSLLESNMFESFLWLLL